MKRGERRKTNLKYEIILEMEVIVKKKLNPFKDPKRQRILLLPCSNPI